MKKKYLFFAVALVLCAVFVLTACEGTPVDTTDQGELLEDGTRVYSVPNAYFKFEKYEVLSKGPTDKGDNFSVFSSHTLEIHAKCTSSLNDVTAIIKLYDSNGKIVGNYRATKHGCDIAENESFVLTADISNDAKETFSVVNVRFEGKTKNRVYRAGEISYNITFVYNNGNPPKMVSVGLGDAVQQPAEIPEKDGYIFEAWFTDPECTQPYDFATSDVDSSFTLYAGYVLNYIRMGQKVVDIAELSTVKITTKSYSSLLWGAFEASFTQKSGEGIILKDDGGNYHVLTTCDIVKKEDGYEKVEHTIEDYYGNKYTATVKHSSEVYNLSIITFEKTNALLVCQLSPRAPIVGDEVVIARYFDGSGYYPYFGKVLSFEKIQHKDTPSAAHDINFDMMVHSAETDARISGRPMFNMNMELVGIQCGTLTKEEVELESKHVIPWDAIQKYLKNYGS